MPTDVIMPQMGESIFEGTVTKWLKKPGDKVQRDEPLFEISTDKVDAEIPAPASGVLQEIKVEEGATVQVNTVVAVIDETGSAAAPSPAKPAAAPAKAPAAPAPPAPQPAAAAPAAVEVSDAVEPQGDGEGIRTSPLVRKIAKENNVDLSGVSGTGMQGRITKEDVMAFIQRGGAAPAAAQPARPAPQPAPARSAASVELPSEFVPLSPMRKKIAERMVESKRISPHVHTVYEVDMTRVVNLRARLRADWERRNGVKLTYTPFVCRAIVAALREYPILNSSLEGDNIHYHRSINLGIAVALDWGLIVPVIKNAAELNFLGLQRAVNDLSERARTKKLNTDDVLGGTFTITNPGSIGGLFGLPIILQPQVAILGTGGITKTPVVLTDAEGVDSIAIRSIMHLILGYDHRIVDGATAGYFLGAIKKFLETWNEDIG